MFLSQVIFLVGISPYGKIQRSLYHDCTSSNITFSWSSHGLSLIERNMKKWILSRKSPCIRRKTTKTFICGLWCAREGIPEDACRVRRQSDIMEI